jgi:23S rRNA (adenine2503-C2)-methyltransferase
MSLGDSTARAPGPAGLMPLQGVLPQELCERVPDLLPGEARRLVSLVHRKGALPPHAPAGVRREVFRRVRDISEVPALEVVSRSPSGVDPFVKYTLRTPPGEFIEAVRIPLERPGRISVCVSSQAGCALGCTFCKTGTMGLLRNLEAWEIVEQVRIARADLPAGSRVHGVVFQGMGEPLANFEAVRRAAEVLSDPSAQAIDARCITVSTVGLPQGIRALARDLPNVRLAWSIGSARGGLRRSLMPIDGVHPLERVYAAVGEHAITTGHAPLWAYTLLAGVNDASEDAVALAEMALRFVREFGVRPRLSLIPYNRIADAGDPYQRTSPAAEARFFEMLADHGVFATRRYSGGADVGAACGQLASLRAKDPGSSVLGGESA